MSLLDPLLFVEPAIVGKKEFAELSKYISKYLGMDAEKRFTNAYRAADSPTVLDLLDKLVMTMSRSNEDTTEALIYFVKRFHKLNKDLYAEVSFEMYEFKKVIAIDQHYNEMMSYMLKHNPEIKRPKFSESKKSTETETANKPETTPKNADEAKIEEAKKVSKSQKYKEPTLEEKKESVKKIQQAQQEINESQQKYREYEQFTAKYVELLKKIYQCESLRGYLEDKGFSPEYSGTATDAIKFTHICGNLGRLVLDIYDHLKKFKSNNPHPLTEDEIDVVETINKLYGETIMFIPKVPGRFIRSSMKDLREPNNHQIDDITAVYVPGIQGDGIQRSALVDGIK